MNSEEPIQTLNQNDSVSTQGKALPEQAKVVVPITMPRQLSILHWINQWQPMGFRVVLNLPFIGNDSDFLFVIRVGPFIPPPPGTWKYNDSAYDNSAVLVKSPLSFYAYNNMTPIFLFGDTPREYPKPKDGAYPIQVTQHDMPPIISSIAQSFRFWRGDMQYRIRTVAGFATQGYTLAMPIKNAFVPIGIYDAYKVCPSIIRQDASYKSCMMNSYALADTSMFRHLEITYPYDYPTPYYDQYAWMSRRTAPSANFVIGGKTPVQNEELYVSEPHGDNFIAIGLRGNLAATQAGSQIMFELEYRCAEGFQFSDPFLPSRSAICSSKTSGNQGFLPHRYPNADRKSDGLGLPQKVQDFDDPPVDHLTARLARLGTSSRRG